MEFPHGTGTEHDPIYTVTAGGYRQLTNCDAIPEDIPVALNLADIGDMYRVADVVENYWPGEPIEERELEQRINKMRGRNDLHFDSSRSVCYLILDPNPGELRDRIRGGS